MQTIPGQEMSVIEKTLASNCEAHIAAATLSARRDALAGALRAMVGAYRTTRQMNGYAEEIITDEISTILRTLAECSIPIE